MSPTGPTDDNEFLKAMSAQLTGPLPGKQARRPFAPQLGYGRHDGPPDPDARAASVLILLTRHRNQWVIPLTVRAQHMAEHPGQVSFPGGATEVGETIVEGALREYSEELGVPFEGVRQIGFLSPVFILASNYVVTPVVAALQNMPTFAPNSAEVSEVVLLSLGHLLDVDRHTEVTIRRPGIRFQAPAIIVENHSVWGATCLMLGELSAVVRRCGKDPG